MKIGIILPCHNEESHMNVTAFSYFLKHHSKFYLCFVNNGSKDNTLTLLEGIKNNAPKKVCVLDIKKKKSRPVVIRAGIRYLNSRVDVDAVQLVDIDFSIKYLELQSVFLNVMEDHFKKSYPKNYGLGVLEKRILGNRTSNMFLLMAVIKSVYL